MMPQNLTVYERGLTHIFATFEPSSSHVSYEATCLSPEGLEIKGIVRFFA